MNCQGYGRSPWGLNQYSVLVTRHRHHSNHYLQHYRRYEIQIKLSTMISSVDFRELQCHSYIVTVEMQFEKCSLNEIQHDAWNNRLLCHSQYFYQTRKSKSWDRSTKINVWGISDGKTLVILPLQPKSSTCESQNRIVPFWWLITSWQLKCT